MSGAQNCARGRSPSNEIVNLLKLPMNEIMSRVPLFKFASIYVNFQSFAIRSSKHLEPFKLTLALGFIVKYKRHLSYVDSSHTCSLRVFGRRSGLFLPIIPFALLTIVCHYASCFSMNFANSVYLALRQSTFAFICIAFNHIFLIYWDMWMLSECFQFIAPFYRYLLFEFCKKSEHQISTHAVHFCFWFEIWKASKVTTLDRK